IDATTGVFRAVVAAASRRAANRVPGGSSDVSSNGESTRGRVSRGTPPESEERKNTMEDFPEVDAFESFSLVRGTVPAGPYLPASSPPAARCSPYRYVSVPALLLIRDDANGSDPASEKEPVLSSFLPDERPRGTRSSILVSREGLKSSVEVCLDVFTIS